jgi:ABC-type polysaccharide/polyol phosphate export permease
LIFWFIFEVGFKSQPVKNIPYILYFTSSIIPWFFFSESLASATNSIMEYSYLVKKIVFRISVLPFIKITSALFIHLFFVLIVFIIFFFYGYKPTIYNIQIIYFIIANMLLVLGISWFTSSLVVFFRDTGQIVSMVLQFGFWLTPIFWSINMMPEKYHTMIKILPMYYIVEGYRNSLLYNKWFWSSDIYLTLNFWSITIFFLLFGIYFFKKVSTHFADVL